MSENNEFDRAAAESGDEAAEGQYVEGDYGTAGTAGENPPEAEEGEYPTGDYGAAGVSGATAVGAEEGDYPEGDYGAARCRHDAARRRGGRIPRRRLRNCRRCGRTGAHAGRIRAAKPTAGTARRRASRTAKSGGGQPGRRLRLPEFRGSGPPGEPCMPPFKFKVECRALNFELTLKPA